jgi:FAD-dependent urate hydroxylase
MSVGGSSTDDLRVLIAGGGVAGLALAAKLRQQGRAPVVIERDGEFGRHGYSVALSPFGTCVLHGLGLYDAMVERAVETRRYERGDASGRIIVAIDRSRRGGGELGPRFNTSHADLIQVLAGGCRDLDIRVGVALSGLREEADAVEATFSDGTSAEFDVVCGCDGVGSTTRALVLGEQPGFHSGWVGWTWWGEPVFPPETVREYWLPRGFFGTYGVPGRSTYVVAVPLGDADPGAGLSTDGIRDRLGRALGDLPDRVPEVALALEAARDPWPWPLADVRSERLHCGRVALCGDAGISLMPTAGVSASTALRGAAALADELSRADARLAPLALELYDKRVARVIRGLQDDSRRLARLLFLKRRATVRARDEMLKHVPAIGFATHVLEATREPL